MSNLQHDIRIEKITLNIGAGKEQSRLDKALVLLKEITGKNPVKTVTHKRIPTWGLRPGLPIGCKVTLRREDASNILKRLLHSKDNKLKTDNFDEQGNLSFGIPEYIDIQGAKYNPQIGILGLDVAITLQKAGFHIKKRKIKRASIGKRQQISKQEALTYLSKTFGTIIE
ncbi:MAG: 50S ribosomal protein L5 [Nanoarchaeota archaeon]